MMVSVREIYATGGKEANNQIILGNHLTQLAEISIEINLQQLYKLPKRRVKVAANVNYSNRRYS